MEKILFIILPLLFPIVIFIGWLVIHFFLIIIGFKLIKIDNVSNQKIIVYVMASILISTLVRNLIPSINYAINYVIEFSISILIIYIFSRYYFNLIGKKLYLFIIYLMAILLVFNIVVLVISLGFLLKPLL